MTCCDGFRSHKAREAMGLGARLISMHNSCAAPRFPRRDRFVLASAQEAFLASSTLANSASTLSPSVLAIRARPWNAAGVPRHMFEGLRPGPGRQE
jgi:hypothetical protein